MSRSKCALIFLMTLLLAGAASAANFDAMLREARQAPVNLSQRLPWDKDRFLNDLAASGRLAELGLDRAQAGQLYDALAARLGVTARPEFRPFPVCYEPPAATVRYAAEFQPQQGIMIRWPFLEPSYLPTYYGMVEALADTSEILVVVGSAQQEQTVRQQCAGQGIATDHLQFAVWATDTVWIRDYGPIFIGVGAPEEEAVLDMAYSRSWRINDDRIPVAAAATLELPYYETDFVQDGGNLLTDGHGTCFSTEQVYTNNPGWTDEQVRAFYRDYLGCEQLILVPVLLNEGTGHIDMHVKIVGPHTALVGQFPETDANYERAEQAAAIIAAATDLEGEPYTVVRVGEATGWTLSVLATFYTYTNGQLVDEVVLVPQYDRPADAEALAVYEALFPGRQVVSVDAAAIIHSGGALHCITMERQDYAAADDDDDNDNDDDDQDDDDNDDDDDNNDDNDNNNDQATPAEDDDDPSGSSGQTNDDEGGACGC